MFRTYTAFVVMMAATGCGVGSDLNSTNNESSGSSIVSATTLSKVLDRSPSYFRGPGTSEYVQGGKTYRKSTEMGFGFEKQANGSYLVTGSLGGDCEAPWSVVQSLPGLKVRDNASCEFDVSESNEVGIETGIARHKTQFTKGNLVILSETTARLEVETKNFRNGVLQHIARATINGTLYVPPSNEPPVKK